MLITGTDSVLSRRATETVNIDEFLFTHFAKAEANLFHAKDNPGGIVNMGTAVNRVMEEELAERLTNSDALRFDQRYQHYFNPSGVLELRQAVADTLTRQLAPDNPVSPDNLVIMNGATSCLDALAYALCDPGDVLLTPTPVYARIFSDFEERCQVDVMPIVCKAVPDNAGESFQLCKEAVEDKIVEALSAKRRVRAFILVNPNNPLGDVYPPSLILDIMKICAKYEMHFICDEIYSLSVFDEDANFHSVLSFKDVPDPERTHFIWAMSKDFALAGFRTGVIHTRSSSVKKCLDAVAVYQSTPALIQHASATLLSDKAWCDDLYLKINRQRLRERYTRCLAKLKGAGINVRKAKAGLFIWFNLGPYLRSRTKEDEMDLFRELLERGVYMVPGTQFYCEEPGWFRAIFAVSEVELEEGLKRILQVVEERKQKGQVPSRAA
ncbi:putative inactive 1-aminocyclopropane-1-carboxylate synthase-like protein 2 isoform X2 [Oratosquilla oratoria]|uniref:putative inactive 1-aminocyclopropane-1-carboxylate synthase-like protein 2 isoform X2 n=1 Tax=Oratosquilla oratoria TaxID=337810 RepID=UPI003F7781A4